jgi:hypothetical protein
VEKGGMRIFREPEKTEVCFFGFFPPFCGLEQDSLTVAAGDSAF